MPGFLEYRDLGAVPSRLCASPAFMEKHPVRTIDDLDRVPLLGCSSWVCPFMLMGNDTLIPLKRRLNMTIRFDSVGALLEAAKDGLGVDSACLCLRCRSSPRNARPSTSGTCRADAQVPPHPSQGAHAVRNRRTLCRPFDRHLGEGNVIRQMIAPPSPSSVRCPPSQQQSKKQKPSDEILLTRRFCLDERACCRDRPACSSFHQKRQRALSISLVAERSSLPQS